MVLFGLKVTIGQKMTLYDILLYNKKYKLKSMKILFKILL